MARRDVLLAAPQPSSMSSRGNCVRIVRSVRSETHVVLDSHAAPPRPVDARLDRHHRARPAARPRRSAPAAAPRAPPARCRGPGCGRTARRNPRPLNVAVARWHRHPARVIPARTPRRRPLVGHPHDLVDLALLVARLPDHHRARDVGAVAADLGAEIQQQEVARARSPAATTARAAAPSAARWRRSTERGTPRSPRRAAPSPARRPPASSVMPGPHLPAACARARASATPAASRMRAISPASFRSRSVSTRSSVGRHCQRAPASTQPLEVAVQQVRGLEAERPSRAGAAPAAARARSRGSPPRSTTRATSPTSLGHLRLVAEVGDEHDVARRHEQQRARSRRSR